MLCKDPSSGMNRQKDKSLCVQLTSCVSQTVNPKAVMRQSNAGNPNPAKANGKTLDRVTPTMTVRESDECHCEMPAMGAWHHRYFTRFPSISPLGGNSAQQG